MRGGSNMSKLLFYFFAGILFSFGYIVGNHIAHFCKLSYKLHWIYNTIRSKQCA